MTKTVELRTVIQAIEQFAPPELALFEYVGLMQGELNQKICKIGLTLDYTLQAIRVAQAAGCQLLVTHHGLTELNFPLQGNALAKIAAAAETGMAVYRCHLNLDFCPGGIIETLAELLQIPTESLILRYGDHTIHGGVRLASDYPMHLNELLERIKVLDVPQVRIAGKRHETFRRIAITSGKGFIPEFLDQVRPEVYIAGEFEQEATKYAEDMGIMLVELSHHASEMRPLESLRPRLQKLVGLPIALIEIPDTVVTVPIPAPGKV